MGSPVELLTLRLALIGILFVFALGVSLTMRSGLRTRTGAARRATRARGPRVVVLVPGQTGLEVGDEIALAGEMTVGRDLANGIVLGDPSVSAFHAAIAVTRDGWRVTDSGSTNGTLVAGRTVEPRGTVLHGGEEISIGKVVVRFQR
jgi:hypothetical protein